MVGYSSDSRVVVCSPDLPITITKLRQVPSDMTATTTAPGQPGMTGKRREPVTTTSTEDNYTSLKRRIIMGKVVTVEEAYPSNLVNPKRKELPKLMSIGDGHSRRIIVEEASSSYQELRKMMTMEETYPQEVVVQTHPPGQPGASSKRKDSQGMASTDDPYQCNICSKTFAVPARLTRHYRTHTGEKPFQCEYCAKSFSVKENLSVHRRIHTKERPYKCEVCARAFEHSGKLHRHMRIHTGERPHKCQVCSKTFIQSGQLVIHMRTHTGEKPYVCGSCGKGFTCSKQLKVHSRTHTGEKPYACDICGKSFGYNHVLKLHQVAHYGEKVYKCTICNDTFTSKKCMEAHIKSHSDNPSSPVNSTVVQSSIASTSSIPSSSSDSGISVGSPGAMSVGSVSSGSGSDKENTGLEEIRTEERYYGDYFSSGQYGHQSGVDLLAAAAAASNLSSMDPMDLTSPEDVLNLISRKSSQSYQNMHPVQTSSNNRQILYHYPSADRTILTSKTGNSHFATPESDIRKRVEAVFASSYSHNLSSLQPPKISTEIRDLDHGTDIRKRVEAALASTIDSNSLLMITPPNSTSVSPASSPEPSYQPETSGASSPRLEISLPPRKRSKMILKSMQMEPTVRYNSVIQYAKAV